MSEKQQDLGKTKVDGKVFREADRVCDAYLMHDPNVTTEMAQQAAIASMKVSRALDARCGTGFAHDPLAFKRLQRLGIDLETLEVEI